MLNFDGVSPHPRHVSFELDTVDMELTSAAKIALEHPDLYTEAEKLAASANAIIALATTGVIAECGAKDA